MTKDEPEIVMKWRKVLKDSDKKSWAVFENGTIVILEQPTSADVQSQAVEIMKTEGPVFAGGEMGDFSVIKPKNDDGWVVTSWKPYLSTYVFPAECPDGTDFAVGLFGRNKRGTDAKDTVVVHVEDNRPKQ